jgi:hypothetical protein
VAPPPTASRKRASWNPLWLTSLLRRQGGILEQMETPNTSTSPVPDASRQNLTIEEASELFNQAGVPRSSRTISRYCEQGILEAVFMDTEKNQRYLISRESVDRRIKEVKQIIETNRVMNQQDMPRRDKTQHDTSSQFKTNSQSTAHTDGVADTTNSEAVTALKTELKKLNEDNLQLRIDKSAKEQFINRLIEEREKVMRQAIQLSREVGRLENQLLQLEAPDSDDNSRHPIDVDDIRQDSIDSDSPPPEKTAPIEPAQSPSQPTL